MIYEFFQLIDSKLSKVNEAVNTVFVSIISGEFVLIGKKILLKMLK